MPVLIVCVQTSSTLEMLLQDAGVDVHALLASGVATNAVEAKQVHIVYIIYDAMLVMRIEGRIYPPEFAMLSYRRAYAAVAVCIPLVQDGEDKQQHRCQGSEEHV
jgi:hypothetical protein